MNKVNEQLETLRNNFESKINVSIETNSKGYNTKVTVYQGIGQKEIDSTIDYAIYAHQQLQKKLQETSIST